MGIVGGGLEQALACTARVASDSPKTKMALPEVMLGLLPEVWWYTSITKTYRIG